MKLPHPHQARVGMAIAALIGLFASAYLFYTYVTGAPITCGLVSGCEAVRASKWAYTFGIPRPFLGLVFYVGVFGLLVARVTTVWRPRLLYRLTMLAAAVGFIESAFLFLVQWLDIKAFCLWCLISAVSATAIAILAPLDRAEAERRWNATKELRAYFYALIVFIPIAFIGIYWLVSPKAPEVTTIPSIEAPSSTSTAPDLESILLRPDTPIEGPASSSVLVVEWGDFQCPACGAFYPTMKAVRDRYAGKIRFAFRQFPLTEIHEHAEDAAIASKCAQKQNKFFPYADALYQHQDALDKDGLLQRARDVGLNLPQFQLCQADPSVKAAVDSDRAEAIKLGLRFTPTIFVNRYKIEEAPSLTDLSKLIDQELRK